MYIFLRASRVFRCTSRKSHPDLQPSLKGCHGSVTLWIQCSHNRPWGISQWYVPIRTKTTCQWKQSSPIIIIWCPIYVHLHTHVPPLNIILCGCLATSMSRHHRMTMKLEIVRKLVVLSINCVSWFFRHSNERLISFLWWRVNVEAIQGTTGNHKAVPKLRCHLTYIQYDSKFSLE